MISSSLLPNGLPKSCEGCPLSTNPKCGRFSRISGSGSSSVMIVGEASGEHEAEEGRPFIEWAPSGSVLEKAIKMAGYTRDEFWITNIVRCRPPNNFLQGAPYEREAIAHCARYLDRAISELKPRAILALGAVALREVTGRSGDRQSISYLRGFVLKGRDGIPSVPSFHPSYIARDNSPLTGLLLRDIYTARAAAAGRVVPVENPLSEIQVYVGVEALRDLLDHIREDPDLWVAYDIETDQTEKEIEDDIYLRGGGSPDALVDGDGIEEDAGELRAGEFLGVSDDETGGAYVNSLHGSSGVNITSIQFAISDRWGVYADWTDTACRELAIEILHTPNPKIAHNGEFYDRKVLEQHGVYIYGEQHDSLRMIKAVQPDLPAGLQQVACNYGWKWPWKHLNHVNPLVYGVADVCSLVLIASQLPMELYKLGIWNGYQRHIREQRELVEIPWERRGIPMSKERLDELREWLNTEIETKTEEIISLVPPELHKKNPPDGYSNLPPRIKEYVLSKPEVQKMFEPTRKVFKNGKEKLIKSKTTISDIYRLLVSGELGDALLSDIVRQYPELRLGDGFLYEFIPFNPKSTQQMVAYLKLRGYEVPRDFKEGKETTADKLMKRLEQKTGDPIIKLSREIRALEKMRNSYTGKIGPDGIARGGWVPDADGRLRSVAKTNSTWQYSSKAPNVFTLPKRRKELADRFRRCLVAEPGHIMIEMDYSAFHDLMTANLANDDVKWRTAKLDPHSYVAAWLVGDDRAPQVLKWADSAIKEYLLEIRERYENVRDQQAKPLNHGTNFGQGYRRLYFENEDYFESEGEAKRMLEMLKRIYPKTFQWQEDLLKSLDVGAGRTPYLQSKWGTRRWFWDVWCWKRTSNGLWYKAKGRDAEAALAFLPSSNSHGMLRDKLRWMAEWGWTDKYELIGFPHDAIWFHCPIEFRDECIERVKLWMEAPVKELANPILCPDGFSCAVDVSMGPDMGSLRKVKV